MVYIFDVMVSDKSEHVSQTEEAKTYQKYVRTVQKAYIEMSNVTRVCAIMCYLEYLVLGGGQIWLPLLRVE